MMMHLKTTSNGIARGTQRLRWMLAMVCAAMFVSAGWAPVAAADESLKDGAKRAGHDLGSAARDIGHGAKQVGKEIGHGAKQAGKAVGNAAKKGGREFKRAFKGEH